MIDLDDPTWGDLSHAYGAADDVPEMLRRLPDKDAWGDIWSALCHQGSVFTASYAAVPHVVTMAESAGLGDRQFAFAFVGAVACAAQGAACPPVLAEDFNRALERCEMLIEETLRSPEVRATQHVTYLLASLAGCRRLSLLGNLLDSFTNEELELNCPKCSGYINLLAEDDGFSSARHDVVSEPNAPRTQLLAADVISSNRVRALCELATDAGAQRIAHMTRQVYGITPCPHCAAAVDIAPALAESYGLVEREE